MRLSQKHPKVFYGWWVVVACFLIVLYAGGATFFGFTALVEPIANEFGWSYAQISFATSLRALGMGLLAPLIGFLVDRWGPRRLVFSGIFTTGLGLIFLSRISSLGMFYAAFALISLGRSMCTMTVMATAVSNWFRKRAGIATGIMVSGIGLGGLMVPIITMLTDTFDWQTAMLSLGLGMFAFCLPLSLVIRHKPEQYGYLPDGEVSSPIVGGGGPASAQSDEVNITVRQGLTSRAFWHIALSAICHSFVVGAAITHIMPHLSSIGVVRATSSLAATALPVTSVCGRLGFGWLGDRVSKRWAATAAFIMMFLGLFLLGYIDSSATRLLPIVIILFGIGWGGNVTTRIGLLRDYLGTSHFGTLLGFCSGVMMVGSILGAPVAGWAFDKWGSYQGTWFAYSAVALVGVVLVLSIPPSPGRSSEFIH